MEKLKLHYDNLFLNNKYKRNISILISGESKAGTTLCSISLAHAMSIKNNASLLIDANNNFSNICSYININQKFFLDDYINGIKTLNQIISKYHTNLSVLCGVTGENLLSEQNIGRINLFNEDLKIQAENYQHTIIDLGININKKNLNLCQSADNIIIVCTEDTTEIVKTFELIRFINTAKLNKKYYLVINKANCFEDGYKIFEKLNKASKLNNLICPNLLGIIRIDTRIRDTIRNKELLLTKYPNSEAALDIINIANKLLSRGENE